VYLKASGEQASESRSHALGHFFEHVAPSAAALFAKTGYPGAKMQDIAKACGATKSMLYHYFPSKDDLLFAMLEEHLERVIAGIEQVLAEGGSPKARFAAFVLVYTQKSAQARRRHFTAMSDVKYLPRSMQTQPTGIIKPQDLCERISRLFLRGFLGEKP
jgi:AcrR family transcriptional regulator